MHRYERSYGAFERTFSLPTTVDPEKIDAQYAHGVLTVTHSQGRAGPPAGDPGQGELTHSHRRPNAVPLGATVPPASQGPPGK